VANILVIDQFAAMGGAQRILLDLATAFHSDGHRLTVLFPSSGPVRGELEKIGVETGDYYLASLASGKKGIWELARYRATFGRTARSIAAIAGGKRFDFVYINAPRAQPAGILAAGLLGIPVVSAVHLIHGGRQVSLMADYFNRTHVKLVTFCSEHAAEPFSMIGAKGRVLPNWVAPHFLSLPCGRDLARAALGLGNGQIAIGVLGRVSKTKGQRVFLDAAAPLLASNPRLKLLMAGGADFEDTREERDLKAEATRYKDRISFIDDPSPVEFLDALDVSVIPSVRPESFGLVAIESMARRLPVVASNRGGLADTVVSGKTGYSVDPSPEAVRAALIHLIDDSRIRQELGLAGRKRVETEYNPATLIPRTISTILEAVT